jgi:NAD(P)-dependent dehydrogenase (short-subunit alcohol dehydrogenase family)
MMFSGQVVAVTGAAGGIGQELCRYFASEGANIAAIDISPKVSLFAAELKGRTGLVAHAVADIANSDEVKKTFESFGHQLGPIDILINNAGFSEHPTLAKTDPVAWQHDINGNLNGAYYCTHAVIPGMKAKGKGSIIAIGSVNGLAALGDPAYSAAKAGLMSLTRSLALEYGRFGIRANIVLPATVRTPLWDHRVAKNPTVLAKLIHWYPLGRIVDPIDVARAVGFLASDAAAAITGIALPVDCGLTAGNIAMARELTLEEF